MDLANRFPAPHNQVAGRVIDGEAVLVLAESSKVQILNEVGARVWELADGTRSLAQIIDTIVGEAINFDGDDCGPARYPTRKERSLQPGRPG